MQYRKDIQILRGVAVLLVVLYHTGLAGLKSGYLGVDVFFVISGFLMSVLYNENKKFEFYKKRALRLLPAYFVTIIVTLVASAFIVTPNEYHQVLSQSLYADLFSPNIGYWMKNSYFSKAEFNPLLHLWSLGVEIQFYLLIPVIFYFLKINKYYLPILFLISISLCFMIVGISPKTSFFMMPLRLWEFLIGYGVARYLTDKGEITGKHNSLTGILLLITIISVSFVEINGESLSFINGHPGLYSLLITVFTGIILSTGIKNPVDNSTIGNILETTGKYSYAIYLVHFPVIVLFLYEPFSGTQLQTANNYDLLWIISITAALSYLMYHLVETALRKHGHINLLLVSSPLIVIIIAYSGYLIQKSMFTPKEMLIFNAFSDRSSYRCGKIFRIINPGKISCEITDFKTAKKQSILLAGNSHADAIKTSFSKEAKQTGTAVYFLVTNDPLAKNSNITPEKIITEAVNNNIKSIILHFAPNSTDITSIIKTVELARKNNIFIGYIMPVPTWKQHIPKALWENHRYSKTLPVQTEEEYDKKIKSRYSDLLKIKSSNFRIYPTKEYFCKKECSFIDNTGKPLYFDSGHLTLTGSDRLSVLFKKIINDSLSYKQIVTK